MSNIKEQIKQYAKSIGIDCIGFTTAASFTEIEERLKYQYEQGFISGFEEKDIQKRIHPNITMPTAKAIIAIAMAYPSRTGQPKDDKRRGYFASASYGKDYHLILKERMVLLATYIATEFGKASQCYSDTGPLVDTAVARRAGLGFIGKNGLLITEEYGSYVYLGYLLSEVEVAEDELAVYGCGECSKCVDACPTSALFGNGSMDAKQCLAFQTQKKGVIEEPYRTKMGKMLYGCDICQMVCPYNKAKDHHHHTEMEPVYEDVAPELGPLLAMTKREFKERFSYMAGAWRGVHVTRRNALIAARNLKAVELTPNIIALLETEKRLEIRVTALETLKKLNGKIPQEYLEEIEKGSLLEDAQIAKAYKELK